MKSKHAVAEKPKCGEEVDVAMVPGGRSFLQKCTGNKGHKGKHSFPALVVRATDQKSIPGELLWPKVTE